MSSEEEIEKLKTQIEFLRADLKASRAGLIRTMREARRCPACEGEVIVFIKRVKESASQGQLTDLAIAHEKSFWLGSQPIAPTQVYACANCGFLEWYAEHIGSIKPDGVNVIVIEPEPKNTPYR